MYREKVISIQSVNEKTKRRRKLNIILMRILLSIIFICLFLIVYLVTPLSKVQSIQISGNYYYSKEEVLNASSLEVGQSIWFIQESDIVQRILKGIEVEKVVIKKDFLQNKIYIDISEFKKVAYLYQNSTYYPIMSQGNVELSKTVSEEQIDGPILIDFDNFSQVSLLIQELNEIQQEVVRIISEIVADPTENNENRIYIYMNDGFHVRATISSLAERMNYYPSIVSQIPSGKKGIIDLEVGSYFEEFSDEEGGNQ